MKIELSDRYEILPFDKKKVEDWAFEELRKEIKRLNINFNIHTIGIPDAFDDGGTCLHSEDGFWLVYHSERGKRSGLSVFTSPFDAVNFFLWSLISSPSQLNESVGLLPRFRSP